MSNIDFWGNVITAMFSPNSMETLSTVSSLTCHETHSNYFKGRGSLLNKVKSTKFKSLAKKLINFKPDKHKCNINMLKCNFMLFRAVYTCIKKPESFVHSGFSWEVARQLPLNTAKNLNRKNHLRSRIFWNSAGFSGVFAIVNACLQSRRVLFGFLVTRYLTFSGITRPRPAT